MAQGLQRPPLVPSLSPEEQARADEFAKREQKSLRRRRTDDQPGITDALWRAIYGAGDALSPVVRRTGQFVKGLTVGAEDSLADPWSERDPDEPLSVEDIGDLIGMAVMPLGSPLRNRAYRTRMLRELGEKIQKLQSSESRDMLLYQLEAHPFQMAAFQHAGGTIRADPKYTPGVLRRLHKTGKIPTRGGNFSASWPRKYVPGLSNPVGDPRISLLDESMMKADLPSLSNYEGQFRMGGVRSEFVPGTAAHELGHFSQELGPSGKRLAAQWAEMNRLDAKANEMFRRRFRNWDEWDIHEAEARKLRNRARSIERKYKAEVEKGAKRTESVQTKRFRDWQERSKGK